MVAATSQGRRRTRCDGGAWRRRRPGIAGQDRRDDLPCWRVGQLEYHRRRRAHPHRGCQRRVAGLGNDPQAHRGRSIEPLRRVVDAPFTPSDVEVIAAWADRRIDISESVVYQEAPDAVRAIHDAHYASEPPDWVAYMARLQYLAEMHVGSRIRAEAAREDAAFSAAMGAAEDG